MNHRHDHQATEATGLAGASGALTVINGQSDQEAGFILPATDGITPVRGRGVDLDFDDARVSRPHAAIVSRGGGHSIEDLGSVAGTETNGSSAQGSVELRHGNRGSAGSRSLATPLPSTNDPARSYRKALTVIVGLIALIPTWMLLEPLE